MFLPPPANNGDENRVSEQPLPAATPHASPGAEPDLAADAPRGDDLIFYVLDCLNQGSSKAEVRKQLIAFGYTSQEAEQVVEDVADWRRRNPALSNPLMAPARDGSRNMMIGGAVCLIGIVVTLGTCMAASGPGGGSYVVAWGAIVFGAVQFFRGLAQSKQ